MAKTASESQTPYRLLVLLGAFIFTVTFIVNAPASFMRIGLDRIGNGFSYHSVEGSLWKGRVNGVRLGETSLGAIDFEWSPLSALSGTVSAKVSAKGGDGRGNGTIGIGLFSEDLTISDGTVLFDLGSIKRYTLYGLPYQGVIRAKIRKLKVSQEECIKADLDLFTDAMTASAVKLSGQPLDLVGNAQCKGKGLQILLNGQSASGQVAIDAVIQPNLSYNMAATVKPERTDLQQALTLLGFERDGSAYVFDLSLIHI